MFDQALQKEHGAFLESAKRGNVVAAKNLGYATMPAQGVLPQAYATGSLAFGNMATGGMQKICANIDSF